VCLPAPKLARASKPSLLCPLICHHYSPASDIKIDTIRPPIHSSSPGASRHFIHGCFVSQQRRRFATPRTPHKHILSAIRRPVDRGQSYIAFLSPLSSNALLHSQFGHLIFATPPSAKASLSRFQDDFQKCVFTINRELIFTDCIYMKELKLPLIAIRGRKTTSRHSKAQLSASLVLALNVLSREE
jgi:hypothetical protein